MEKISKDSLIRDLPLSTRTRNMLYANSRYFGVPSDDTTINWDLRIEDLEGFSLDKLRRFVGCGKSSLKEIKELCEKAGVKLLEKDKEPAAGRAHIYLNRHTRAGRALLEMARVLQKEDNGIVIGRIT